MTTVLHVLVILFLVVVLGWVVVFGSIGMGIAHAKGHSLRFGFLWGVTAGPIGWLVILFHWPRYPAGQGLGTAVAPPNTFRPDPYAADEF